LVYLSAKASNSDTSYLTYGLVTRNQANI